VQNSKPGLNLVDVHFSRERHVVVRFNDEVVLDHNTPFLITAPSQVKIGSDTFFGQRTEFPGRVIVIDDGKASAH
jgi:hypothetical protein